MTDGEVGAGLSQARGKQVLGLTAAQLGVRNLGTPPADLPEVSDRVYTSNQELWRALIDEHLRATAMVTLEDFWLSEWFPLRPGLFHTPRGLRNRARANRYVIGGPGVSDEGLLRFQDQFGRRVSPQILRRLRLESAVVYDPYGKSFMLDGGIGCVRLGSKQISAGRAWFMGASSTPVAHEGIPIALPEGLYAEFIGQLAAQGSLRCTITGRLTQIPPEFDPLYRDLIGIPQVYVLAERLEPSNSSKDIPFLSTGAVMIEAGSASRPPSGTWDLTDGIYAAFVSFYTGMPNAIGTAAEWLADIYVHGLLDGRVLTDFDEQVRRFSGTTFSLDQVMGGRISTIDAERVLNRCAASPDEIHRIIERIVTVNGDVWNVVGDSNVIATRGSAAANSGGAAATGISAAATQGASAAVGGSSAAVDLMQRAKASRWTQSFGAAALVAAAAATTLLILKITNIGIAGYILAIVAIVVGVIPLFSK